MSKEMIGVSLLEVIYENIDEELEQDILDFINEEIAVEEVNLYEFFQIILDDVKLYWLEEYQAKWNPSSKIYDIVVEEYLLLLEAK